MNPEPPAPPPPASDQDFVLKVVGEYHQYLRQVAGFHMTWLAFHVTANVALFAYLSDKVRDHYPVLIVFAVVASSWNVAGAVGSWFVADYYEAVAEVLRAADARLPQVAHVRMSSALPQKLWSLLARIIVGGCVVLTLAWIAFIFVAKHPTP